MLAAPDELRTDRLLLRRWRAEDSETMAVINRDPEVAQFLNRAVDEDAVIAFHGNVSQHWEQHGFGFYVVESTEPESTGKCLGFVGLAHPSFLPALAARLELGWRLGRAAWGRGLATEGAWAVRELAFDRLGVNELISIIHPDNVRSQRVAGKLDMTIEQQVFNPVLGRLVDVWQLNRPKRQRNQNTMREQGCGK